MSKTLAFSDVTMYNIHQIHKVPPAAFRTDARIEKVLSIIREVIDT